MFLRITLIALCILPLAGCSSFAPNASSVVSSTPGETVAPPTTAKTSLTVNQPARIAILWKENVLQAPGQLAKRGFVGRLYFYNSQDELVQVDGELNVYMYDDTYNDKSDVADLKFVFPAEKFHQRYNPSELGHSYSVWIPCADYGDVRKSLTLITKFTTTDGQTVMGRPNRLSLSGRTPDATFTDYQMPNVPAGDFSTSGQALNEHESRRKIETIPIPTQIAERIRNAPANRIPPAYVTQNLNDMESPTRNPQGDRFNQVRVQQSLNDHGPVSYQRSRNHFNDGGQRERSAAAQGHSQTPFAGNTSTDSYGSSYGSYSQSQTYQPRTQFGRPGSIR